MNTIRFVALVALTAWPLASQGGAASLQGRVLDEAGRPLGEAWVLAFRALSSSPALKSLELFPPLPTGPRVAQTTAARDGSFTLTGLPAGNLVICAEARENTYLPNCAWTPRPPLVTLANGETKTGFEVRLQAGAILKVQLNDPQRLLGSAGGAGAEADAASAALPRSLPRQVFVGLLSPRRTPTPVRAVSEQGAVRLYEITVPLDVPLELNVFSRDLALAKEDGTPLAAGSSIIRVVQRRGQDHSRPVIIHVTGTR